MPVKNTRNDVWRYINRSDGMDACWKWTGGWGGRSDQLRPYFGYEGQRSIAYRLVWELVHGNPPPSDKMLLHSCDNGAHPIGCCNPAHLRLGEAQENANDMKSRERHGLPHNVVKAIRRLLDEGRSQQTIADLYGVSRETISAIATGRVYSHVKEGDS